MSSQNDQTATLSRMSSTSIRSSSIETTVTKLLMSTKHLLQVLTQWSKGSATGKTVSDAYVQLGNDFKLVSKHFVHQGVDVSDIKDVPLNLRRILEATLREKPCDDTLNKYLPQIREIIVTLLDKLKTKQAFLKSMKNDQVLTRRGHQQQQQHVRNISVTSGISISSLPDNRDKVITQPNEPVSINHESQTFQDKESGNQGQDSRTLSQDHDQIKNYKNLANKQDEDLVTSEDSDALSQLKKGTTIQRRASKRYSAYHMAKLTSQSTTDAITASHIPSVTKPSANVESTTNHISTSVSNSIEDSNMKTNGDINYSNGGEVSDSAPKMYTLFLKLDQKVKKCSTPLLTSLNSLRLLFVERFAYSPKGESFPDIYIRDPVHLVFYELDEQNMLDLKDGSLLELRSNTETLDLEKNISTLVQQVKDEIQKSHDDLLAMIENSRGMDHDSVGKGAPKNSINESSNENKFTLNQVQHHISVLRQIYMTDKKETENKLGDVLSALEQFKTIPFSSDSSVNLNYSYVENSQNKLGSISDNLLSKVDDLQDLIEILRKDVADRGSKPSSRRLDSLFKDIKEAENGMEEMQRFIISEKPHWKKIWENELDKVCEEQQFLSLQEDLISDLKEDLHRTSETFDLVKQCCKEKDKNTTKSKVHPPVMPLLKPGTFNQVREEMLLAVQSLNPDHESRQDAIERAEKLWEREKEYKKEDKFKDELGDFVENSALKKSGGVEEIERQRQLKDAENLRSNFVDKL